MVSGNEDCHTHNGYSTAEALSRLHEELSLLVKLHQNSCNTDRWNHLKAFSFAAGNCYPWPAILSVTLSACVLAAAIVFYDEEGSGSGSRSWLAVEAVMLLLTVIVSICLSYWNHRKWENETLQIIKHHLNTIDSSHGILWEASCYNNINTPISPCISLQWTYRDNQLVNLPQPLLVSGDIIKMRPGHKAPAKCEEVEPDAEGITCTLEAGDILIPDQDMDVPDSTPGPHGRTPLKAKIFRVLETPILENFRLMLSGKIQRPKSVLANECHTVVFVWILRLLPVAVGLVLLINIPRYIYIRNSSGYWPEMLLVMPIHTVMPLLPLTLPFLWFGINTYGQARIFAAFQVARTLQNWPFGSMSSLGSFSTISVEEARVDVAWRSILSWFWNVLTGDTDLACQNFHLLHVLGSVSSLCCVDKKGILSWSNPSAEKVFFFSVASRDSHKQETGGEVSSLTVDFQEPNDMQVEITVKSPQQKKKKVRKFPKCDLPSRIEVLDLTHDAKDAFRVFFDDPDWKNHIDSLKPLGLCTLLNTCNLSTAVWYTCFSDHVGCAALQKEETVAVVNRRCLCEVARQIGFTDQALEVFSLEKTFGIYRQVPAEEMEKERVQRAKSFLYHKIPMPNLTSVVVRDRASGMYQLLTQGTAEIVLDNCTDYWNGITLCTLTELDRKRILDFYHRNSMAAYCTAFSYKPIGHSIASHVENEFIELVSMPPRLLERFLDVDASSGDGPPVIARSFSVDSLMDDSSLGSVEDVAGYYEAQKNQTFIGMAALQYQARQDFVQLIEKLESSCIRFVHFSKENELRSRVFSEKMGLEAGWNCHISLLNDDGSLTEGGPGSGPGSIIQGRRSADSVSQDHLDMQQSPEGKTAEEIAALRSQSAPCMIALDETQVKFDVPPSEELNSLEGDQDSDGLTIKSRQICNKSCYSINRMKGENFKHPLMEMTGEVGEDQKNNEEDIESAEKQKLLTRSSTETSFSSSSVDLDRQSDSRYTSSYVTEGTDDSLTGALDNRAQLPRGIDRIRPHLEKVDNVPLLVNLFTDCTPAATQEMIKIMQENGEVVLCLGSSLNMANTPIFLQADCSIAIEPLYPQLCARTAVEADSWSEDQLTPTQLASSLLACPCSLVFQREDTVSILQLVAEARHHMRSMRNCFYLLLCCELCVTLSMVLTAIFLLPPPLTPPHLLWLLLLALPLLALSLMGNPVDPRIMGIITNKNKQHVSKQVVIQFLLQILLRFIPSIIVALVCFGLTLFSYCQNTAPTVCFLYSFSEQNQTFHDWEDKFSGGLILAQNIFHLYILIFFVVISMNLVHWLDHIWHHPPFTNKFWSITAGSLLVVQALFCIGDIMSRNQYASHPMPIQDVHPAVWILGAVWPFAIIGSNELVKNLEKRFFLQHQRRARLDFGTKLGMNSPF